MKASLSQLIQGSAWLKDSWSRLTSQKISMMKRSRGHNRVYFLPVHAPNRKTTQHDIELVKAEARAHAASVSYSQQRGPSFHRHGTRSRCPCHAGKTQARNSTPEALALLHEPIESGSRGKLDPFIRLAADLPRRDRDLIHFCKTTVIQRCLV